MKHRDTRPVFVPDHELRRRMGISTDAETELRQVNDLLAQRVANLERENDLLRRINDGLASGLIIRGHVV